MLRVQPLSLAGPKIEARHEKMAVLWPSGSRAEKGNPINHSLRHKMAPKKATNKRASEREENRPPDGSWAKYQLETRGFSCISDSCSTLQWVSVKPQPIRWELEVYTFFFFIRSRNLNLSLGVLKLLAIFRLK